jgi:hypothetical protein
MTIPNKGTITYTYDAAGNKLQKTTHPVRANLVDHYHRFLQ